MHPARHSPSPLVERKDAGRRVTAGEPSLQTVRVKRDERRRTHQRGEDRFTGVVAEAVLITRGRKNPVRVENISTSGVMVVFAGDLRIGEKVRLRFDGFDDLLGAVRWIGAGKAGIELPKDSIELLE